MFSIDISNDYSKSVSMPAEDAQAFASSLMEAIEKAEQAEQLFAELTDALSELSGGSQWADALNKAGPTGAADILADMIQTPGVGGDAIAKLDGLVLGEPEFDGPSVPDQSGLYQDDGKSGKKQPEPVDKSDDDDEMGKSNYDHGRQKTDTDPVDGSKSLPYDQQDTVKSADWVKDDLEESMKKSDDQTDDTDPASKYLDEISGPNARKIVDETEDDIEESTKFDDDDDASMPHDPNGENMGDPMTDLDDGDPTDGTTQPGTDDTDATFFFGGPDDIIIDPTYGTTQPSDPDDEEFVMYELNVTSPTYGTMQPGVSTDNDYGAGDVPGGSPDPSDQFDASVNGVSDLSDFLF